MKFLIFLSCLALERYLNLGHYLYRFNWLTTYAKQLHKWLGNTWLWQNSYVAVAVITVPVMLLVEAIYLAVGHWLLLAKFFVGLLVFLYCLGPQDLYHQLNKYLVAVEDNDAETAHKAAAELVDKPLTEHTVQLDRLILSQIFYQANERLFAVLFWFLLLGPLGAVFYRMVALLHHYVKAKNSFYSVQFIKVLQQVQGILEWVPARLTALIYGIVGKFSDTAGYWLDTVFSGIEINHALLTKAGFLALKIKKNTEITIENVRAGLILIDRATVVYLIASAVILVSWLYIL